MSQTEPEPSQSTEMFRAFVDRGPRDDQVDTPQRRVSPLAIVGIVVVVVVLAILAWLLF